MSGSESVDGGPARRGGESAAGENCPRPTEPLADDRRVPGVCACTCPQGPREIGENGRSPSGVRGCDATGTCISIVRGGGSKTSTNTLLELLLAARLKFPDAACTVGT